MVAASAPVRHVQREHEDGHHSQAEAEDDHHLGHPRLVSVLWVLEVHKDVQVRNNDQDAHDDRDKDEEPVVTLRHGCSYPPGLHLELQAPSLREAPYSKTKSCHRPKTKVPANRNFRFRTEFWERQSCCEWGRRSCARERATKREREREGRGYNSIASMGTVRLESAIAKPMADEKLSKKILKVRARQAGSCCPRPWPPGREGREGQWGSPARPRGLSRTPTRDQLRTDPFIAFSSRKTDAQAVKKAAKVKALKRGVKEVVKAVRKGTKGTCIIAGDVSPIDVLSHVPVLCEDNEVPYVFVPSKEVRKRLANPPICPLGTPPPHTCTHVHTRTRTKRRGTDARAFSSISLLPPSLPAAGARRLWPHKAPHQLHPAAAQALEGEQGHRQERGEEVRQGVRGGEREG